jgi:hypothetical protein
MLRVHLFFSRDRFVRMTDFERLTMDPLFYSFQLLDMDLKVLCGDFQEKGQRSSNGVQERGWTEHSGNKIFILIIFFTFSVGQFLQV